jgi:tagatose 6-phosphate kinase
LILTVTLNLAVDVTYFVERYERGETVTVADVARRAGGKGVNVARVLHGLGREVLVTGLAGGLTGRDARAEMAHAGLREELVEIEGDSRTTVMVVEADGQATGFSEPGPAVSAEEWRAFRARFDRLVAQAHAVVIAGSLPRGMRADVYAELIRDAGVPVLLDASGDALEQGASARPEIVKINQAELRGVTGAEDVVEGARALRALGAGTVVVSQGADGLTGVGADWVLRAAPPEALRGNPTGAGDAASAALIAGRCDGREWSERLADAVALSAAAVRAPLAGSFDAPIYERLRDGAGVSSRR